VPTLISLVSVPGFGNCRRRHICGRACPGPLCQISVQCSGKLLLFVRVRPVAIPRHIPAWSVSVFSLLLIALITVTPHARPSS